MGESIRFQVPHRGGDEEHRPPPAATAPKPQYLIPRDHWPDYECDEHEGKGWAVTIVKRSRDWALCRFVNAWNYRDEWRRYADLTPISNGSDETTEEDRPVAPDPLVDVARKASDPLTDVARKTASLDTAPTPIRRAAFEDEPIPNIHTQPPPDSTNAIHDPVRPQRDRQPPERLAYSSLAMTAAYVECAIDHFNLHSPRLSDAAFHVDVHDGADRLAKCAGELLASRGTTLLISDENTLRHEFDVTNDETKRALMIAADVAQASLEFGTAAPQTKMMRELYAVATFDAASRGVAVPHLNALVMVACGEHTGQRMPFDDIFNDEFSGCMLQSTDPMFGSELFAVSKAKTSPDIFSERQMRGPEWDTPKQMEIAKIKRLEAKRDVLADDPSIKGMQVCEMLWTGRCKRNPDGSINKKNARCCARGDLDKARLSLTSNDCTSPVARNSSNLAFDACACLHAMHKCDYDVPGAYLQGEQLSGEARVYRPPYGFRSFDERGVEILWYSLHPFYGQTNAGAIWNRTINETLTSDKPPHGCGFGRCPQDPSVYGVNVSDGQPEGQVNNTLYVDDGRLAWGDSEPAKKKATQVRHRLGTRYGITFGPDNPDETHFLGANILTEPSRRVASVRATSYIDLQVKRYADGDVSASKRFPAHWSSLPADETLVKTWEAAMATRTPASPELTTRYGSLFGSLLHAVKFRPEIAAALGLLGACLTFPNEELYDCLMHVLVYLGRSRKLGITYSAFVPNATKLEAYADSNWSVTRSTTGFVIMLAGAAIVAVSRRQHCITMSSCEAELVALADLAIELLHVVEVVNFLGHATDGPISARTDSKAAYDLCHRFTTAQNSRHVDRKLFKMRELRGAGRVTVEHIPGDSNPADLFTKILSRQPFEKHRKFVLNLAGDTGVEHARRERMTAKIAPACGARQT